MRAIGSTIFWYPEPRTQHPSAALAADLALLDQAPAERWYVVAQPAVVVGLAMHRYAASVLDLERCARAGVPVLERRAGGGAVLLDRNLVCYAVALPVPHPLVSDDLTASYRWLGEHFSRRLQDLRVPARRIEVDEARADVAQHRHDVLIHTCFGVVSPHEVVVDSAKVVGFAQVRRRHAALFQVGLLLRNQASLADFFRLPDEAARRSLREALERRTIGLEDLLGWRPALEDLVRALSPDLRA